SGRLEVFRGRRDHRRKLLEESPWLRVEAGRLASAGVEVEVRLGPGEEKVRERGSVRGRLSLLELDGEGGSEVVLRRFVEGRAVIRVVDFGG
ncbi:MAG: hypothetical protein MI919_36765, partial [Holophagales bacterium]|nr:hypothetical protein [Holophagales bacterium]